MFLRARARAASVLFAVGRLLLYNVCQGIGIVA